jgi:Holliday junction resolvase-like predicted endonuclease
MHLNNQFWGRMGEAEAKDWLISNGHEILEQNWRTGKLEVDIISLHNRCCHFTEVKTRFINKPYLRLALPEIQLLIDRQFTLKKQDNLKIAIKNFKKINPQLKRYQIDFLAVVYFSYGKYIYHYKHPISCSTHTSYSQNRSHFYDRFNHVPHF